MALPSIAELCVHPPLFVDLRIRMPGGATLSATASGLVDPSEQVAKLMGSLNTALAPLAPLLDLVEAVLSAVKVFEAVKSLNPFKIATALVDLVKIADRLKLLLPPLSAPMLVKDVVVVVRVYLEGLRAQLGASISAQAKVDLARVKAAALTAAAADLPAASGAALLNVAAQLEVAAGCAEENLAITFEAMAKAGGPVNRILNVVGTLGAAVGLPALPSFEIGANASASLAPLDALIVALSTVEVAIPV